MHLPFFRVPLSSVLTLAFLGAVAVTGVACSSESGILIEVGRDGATTPPSITRLRFYIGVGSEQRFLQDAASLDVVDLGEDRDIETDPFELLLRDGIGEGAAGEQSEQVMVAVVGLAGNEEVGFARLAEPVAFVDGKVVRWTLRLVGDADFGVTGTGCARYDGGVIAPDNDRDCDNDAVDDVPADCDDDDPRVGPSRDEVCFNDRDDNCNGEIDEETDADSDGVTNCGGDCNDANPDVKPGAEELCDGIDNNCNKQCDEAFDVDEDGFTVCGSRLEYPDGTSTGNDEDDDRRIVCSSEPDVEKIDCDDHLAEVNPEADEVCDGLDNDCNELCDDGFDADDDKYTTCGTKLPTCEQAPVDCAPDDPDVNPGAAEVCDGRDTNCDGAFFPAQNRCYATADVEGQLLCFEGTRICDDQNGGGFEGPCDVSGALEPVPDALCEAYAQCEVDGAPDPLACADEAVTPGRVAECTVAVTSEGVCPGASVPAVSPGGEPCLWAILGGVEQRHYRVGFGAVPVEPRVQTCSSEFTIEASRRNVPRRDTFLVVRDDAGLEVGELIRVELSPERGDLCPESPLTCQISPISGGSGDGDGGGGNGG